MAKGIRQRIKDSFPAVKKDGVDDVSQYHDDASKYLDWLRGTISDYAQSLRRNALFLLLLIAVFEITVESSGSAISLGPFRVYKGSIVTLVIPFLVSYMSFQTTTDGRQISRLSVAFSEAFKIWSRNGEANDLDTLVSPPFLIFSNPGVAGHDDNIAFGDQILFYVTAAFDIVLFVGVFAFEVQAYYVLYRPHLSHHILWLISAILTGLILVISLVYYIATFITIRGEA